VHRKDEAIPIEYAREIAAGIPSARIVELQGIDHWPTVGDIKSITGEVEEFLTGSGTSTYPTGCWPPCCLPTSSIRRGMPRGSGTAVGASCSHATTTSPTPKSAVSKGVSYSTPATVFLAAFDGPTRALRSATTVAARMKGLGIDV